MPADNQTVIIRHKIEHKRFTTEQHFGNIECFKNQGKHKVRKEMFQLLFFSLGIITCILLIQIMTSIYSPFNVLTNSVALWRNVTLHVTPT